MWLRVAIAVGAMLLASCASTPKGSAEAEIAAGLAGQQRYRDAIAAIDQAIAKEPRNTSYQQTRTRYLSDLNTLVKQKVDQALRGTTTEAELDAADAMIKEAIAAGAPEADMNLLSEQVANARESLYGKLEEQYRQGRAAMDQEYWVQAHEIFTDIDRLYPNYEDVSQRLTQIRAQASRSQLAEAGRALKADELDAARDALTRLLEVDPGNKIARNMLGKIEERDNKDYFAAKAAESNATGDDLATRKYCRKVLEYDPADARCIELLDEISKRIARSLVDETSDLIAQGKLFLAADRYFELHQYEDPSIAQSRGALQDRLAKNLNRAATLAAEDNKPGQAWVIFEKLKDVDPTYRGLGEAQRDVEDDILNKTRKSVAVFDFTSPSDASDAGNIIANNLRSRLFNNAGRDIRILERDRLKSILEEMKLGQIGVVSEESTKEMGRIYGIDYAIMGNVLLYKVDSTRSSSSKTVRYQIGETIEDNIDYLNWLAVNPRPTKAQLSSAPQAKVKVPSYAITEYDVAEEKKVGFIGLSFRIVDVSTGENTRVDTLERKREVRDTGSEGLQDAGIEYDPMEVPTDTELLQTLTDEVVDIMSVDVLRPLQSLEKTYFEQGETYERRNEPMRAVESYVDGIFNERLKAVSASPLTAESEKRIAEIMNEKVFTL